MTVNKFLDLIIEINIFWAAHQAHHSSEDYNLTTALRQSVVQNYTSAVSLESHSSRPFLGNKLFVSGMCAKQNFC